jgi:hypothetical protein
MDLVLIALVVGLIVILIKSQRAVVRTKQDPRQQQIADQRWAAVRRVAEEDVTQLGQQIADTPVAADLPADGREDFDDALSAYERAKEALAAAQHPDDLQWVTRSIDDGRFALARLDARRIGAELPSRKPPCFFDQRHGIAIEDRQWAPPNGASRDVPVCAACAARLADGQDPAVRMVETPEGARPYYEAGAEYAPWARGYYAASGLHVMNSVMLGMLLMNAMYLPPGFDYGGTDGGDGGDAGGDAGGDYGGGDYGSGDYGGGFEDTGGFDFGGF